MTVAATSGKTSSVYARVDVDLVRRLDLARELDRKTRSDAIRFAIEAYIVSVTATRSESHDG